jgi:hypothetical protein
MRADAIIMAKPCVDDDLSLVGGCEPLDVEHFVAESAVGALVVSVLSW